MTIRYSRKFRKQFKMLATKEQDQFWVRLELFKLDPFDSGLRNHPLKGKLLGLRSINIAGDLRAIYSVVDGELYIYEMIGSHSQLYG